MRQRTPGDWRDSPLFVVGFVVLAVVVPASLAVGLDGSRDGPIRALAAVAGAAALAALFVYARRRLRGAGRHQRDPDASR